MSGGSTWRSPTTAADFSSHDYADFAQEFLRRNEDYGRDHRATQRRIGRRPANTQHEQEGLARRWGLSFPLPARCRPSRRPGALVTAGPRHHDPR